MPRLMRSGFTLIKNTVSRFATTLIRILKDVVRRLVRWMRHIRAIQFWPLGYLPWAPQCEQILRFRIHTRRLLVVHKLISLLNQTVCVFSACAECVIYYSPHVLAATKRSARSEGASARFLFYLIIIIFFIIALIGTVPPCEWGAVVFGTFSKKCQCFHALINSHCQLQNLCRCPTERLHVLICLYLDVMWWTMLCQQGYPSSTRLFTKCRWEIKPLKMHTTGMYI